MNDAMTPVDSEARERALDPSRSFIVQAPAGSQVIVRASTGAGVQVEAEGGLQAQKLDENSSGKITTRAAGPQSKTAVAENEQRFLLRGDG